MMSHKGPVVFSDDVLIEVHQRILKSLWCAGNARNTLERMEGMCETKTYSDLVNVVEALAELELQLNPEVRLEL